MSEGTSTSTHPAFPWLALSAATWFAAWGISSVVVSWFAVGVLHATGIELSFAQMAPQLAPLGLLVFGGAIADRVDPRWLLGGSQLLLLAPIAAFLALVIWGEISLAALIAYGLCLGVASAFSAPARDTLLSRVAGTDLMRAVTALTICQFGGQAVGNFGGGKGAEWLGIPTMLGLQSALIALGAFSAARLPPPLPPSPHGSAWRAMRDGLATVSRTPALRVPVGLVTAIGVFFMGPFLIAFPLLIHDVYHGGPGELGIALGTFPTGTILGSFLIRARGGIARKGRAMLLAMANGTVMLALLSTELPYWGFLVVALLWGTGGSVFINCSRTLVQEAAPPAQRGRIMSIYQLGFVGSGPLGMFLTGVLCERFGVLPALSICAAGMATVLASVATFSSARKL